MNFPVPAPKSTMVFPGTIFIFIDRRESSDRINKWILEIIPKQKLTLVEDIQLHDGRLDDDEQVSSGLGNYLDLFSEHPRVKFFYESPIAILEYFTGFITHFFYWRLHVRRCPIKFPNKTP